MLDKTVKENDLELIGKLDAKLRNVGFPSIITRLGRFREKLVME